MQAVEQAEAITTAPGKLITRKEAAELLSVHIGTIDRFIKQGKLHRVKWGTSFQASSRVKLSEVQALMN